MNQIERLRLLHRGKVLVEQLSLSIQKLYETKRQLSIENIPLTTAIEHTMFEALNPYVAQKLPTEAINRVLLRGGTLEVHGIYPTHVSHVFSSNTDFKNWVELEFYHKPTTRRYNAVRPRFFESSCGKRLVVCVTPGSDYIRHYGTMIRHYCTTEQFQNYELKLVYYPLASETLASWTQLDSGFVKEGDLVLIGYVDEMHSALYNDLELKHLSSTRNPYHESRRYQLANGRNINFLGVNYSFWGNISRVLAEGICSRRPSELIYIGKLGSMTTPDSLYSQLFVPSRYTTLDHDRIADSVSDVSNGILRHYPHLDTGMHVSVPTVLEEDFLQRDLSHSLKAHSIDNEISQIARAVSDSNMFLDQKITFSAFHFATDYVRTAGERTLNTSHDLSNNRNLDAVSKKDLVLQNISRIMTEYLENAT